MSKTGTGPWRFDGALNAMPAMQTTVVDPTESGTRGVSILTLERGVPTVLPIPAPIPKVGIGAGIVGAPFSLISRGRRAAHASRPPALSTRKLGKVRGVGK
jgi:hypothetical protein